jgi:secretion/DNA translocation related CpaE-like protein
VRVALLVHRRSRVVDLSTACTRAALPVSGVRDAGWMSASAATRPLLLTRDPELRDELLRLCAAAAVTPDVVGDVGLARRDWLVAPCVLVGADCAAEVSALGLPRRAEVSLVAHGPESADLWRDAVALRADRVVVVPEEEGALVDRLADTVDGGLQLATTIGVIGARGGAGASTLAAALALTAARDGVPALLVDADALGGSVELVVGCESEPGMRWPDVASTQGRVGAAALRAALPSRDGLAVLSWRQREPAVLQRESLTAMLSAGQRGSDVVIMDLPRQLDGPAGVAASRADRILVVACCDVGSVAAGGRLLGSLSAVCGDLRLVVRRLRGHPLAPELVASSLGLRLAAVVPTRRSVSRSVEEGLGPPARGRLASVCSQLLDDLGPLGSRVQARSAGRV